MKKIKGIQTLEKLYFQNYHFSFYKFGIIGKLVKSSDRYAIFFPSKEDEMYLLFYWVINTNYIMIYTALNCLCLCMHDVQHTKSDCIR